MTDDYFLDIDLIRFAYYKMSPRLFVLYSIPWNYARYFT